MIRNLQQKNIENGLSKRVVTNKMAALWHKRERQINGYISQTVGLLFKKVKAFGIDTVVVGYNAGWKQKSDMGKRIIKHLFKSHCINCLQQLRINV